MGERRKRRSLWDKEAETKLFSGVRENNNRTGKEHHSSHDSGQYHDFSASGSYRAPSFRDQSGQPSLDSFEEIPVAPLNGSFTKSRENAREGKEIGGDNRYYQKMSPGFKNCQSLGNDRSHSHRYQGRGRSRSRSRTRGRSRSRSLSRGRERERVRGRSRSRSRSRGDGIAESWRNRADHGHISRRSYSGRGPRSELRDDVSDPYQGEDDQFQNKSRSAVPCKDFMKGKCRWGDTCRFSHHCASDETFGRGTRYMSSDKDSEQQPYRNGKPLCKYFAAGKCDRNNCRFSHEDSRFNRLEGRQGKVTDEGSLRNENINWGIPERTDYLIDRDNQPPHPAGNDTYSGDLGTAEYIGKENMANNQEVLMLHGSQLQNQDGNLNVQGLNRLEIDQRCSVEAWPNVSQVSHIEQQGHGVVENNPVSSFRSDVLDEVKDSRNAADPIPLSGQNSTQNGENVFGGHSSIPDKTESGQNMPYPNPSHLNANLNLQSQIRNHQNAFQMRGMLETRVPQFFPNSVTSEHSDQFTNSLVSVIGQPVAPVTNPVMFPTQGFENEHSRKDADTQVPNPMVMVLSFSDGSAHVPLVETTNMQSNPVSVSQGPINPMENDRGTDEHGNHTEEGNQMEVGRSSPLSMAGMEPDNSNVDHSGRPKLKQEMVLANSEVNEGKRAVGEESKGVKNNKHSETQDGHGKAEESIANKDDKGMRLFKNSLIEFVKDILKPTWKEGRMSREVHKTIVKKVVDKVTSTIQVDHIPKTQDKVEQYLSYSKPKIAKLVQAYVGRCLKTDS